MIKKQLEQLSLYIKEIETRDALDWYFTYLKQIKKKDVSDGGVEGINLQFQKDVDTLFKKYNKQGWSDEMIILQCSTVLSTLAKKASIHSYAYSLGLEPSLYKDEMRLLFKGIKK